MTTRLDTAEQHHQKVLDLLARVIDISDERIGAGCGMSRQTVQSRRVGSTKIRLGEVPRFAAALGVPASCFQMSLSELLHWLAEYDVVADRYILSPGCTQLELVPRGELTLSA